MISFIEAEEKARNYYKDYDIISKREDEEYYRFSFGIKGERPIPGMEIILINKRTGELSTYNPFYEIQMKAPKITDDYFKNKN